MMRPRSPASALGTAVAAASLWTSASLPVHAQVPELGPASPGFDAPQQAPQQTGPEYPGNFGLNLSVAVPQGEFGRNIGAGLGLTGDLSFRLLGIRWLGLRLDGGVIWYGYETRRERVYVEQIPIDVETRTENKILQLGIGPQFHATGYPLSADLYALVGTSRFATTSSASLDNRDVDEWDIELSSTTHLSDWSPSITLGGELNWTIDGDRRGFLLGIGLGLEYRRHGTTRYLREGSIQEVGGRPVFEPLESRADFWVIRIGIRGGSW